MEKSFRKAKPDPNTFYNMGYNTWEIFITILNTQRLNQIIDFLERKSHWAFVWTEQNLSKNYYVLYGYIMLPYPQNQDCFRVNLGNNGLYTTTNEDPNIYRARGLDTIDNPKPNYQPVIRIESG
jgi:hypothetical protein